MAKDVVAYYCGGIKPVIELLVSLYSLRKYFSGEVIICLGETSLQYLPELVKSNDFTIKIVPNSANDQTVRDHWATRWVGMSMVTGDRVLHPDCDTTYAGPLDLAFNCIHEDPNYITTFHSVNDGNHFPEWEGHVEEYKKIDPNFNETKPFYIEFGLLGWRGNWPYCLETAEASRISKDDQTAMSYVLMKHGRKAYVPPTGGQLMRRARAYYRLSKKQYHETLVWHTTPAYFMWWDEFLEAIDCNWMGMGDRSYLRSISRKCYKLWRYKQYPNLNQAPWAKAQRKSRQ